YLGLGAPGARLVTIEGAPEIAAIAEENIRLCGAGNVNVMTGNFDDLLPGVISSLERIDFAFIDGNHQEQPTIRYFEQLLPAIHNDAVIIFDDIYWSPGIESAWKTIKEHPAVRCSIDRFFIVIIFFRKEFMEKQHFTVRF